MHLSFPLCSMCPSHFLLLYLFTPNIFGERHKLSSTLRNFLHRPITSSLLDPHTVFSNRRRDSLVGIVAGYELDGRGVGVRVPVGARFFSSPRRSDMFWGPPSLLSNGYWGLLSRGIKRPGHDADHSPPTSVEVKNTWIYTSTVPHVFMA
jgi:hypothetical protein